MSKLLFLARPSYGPYEPESDIAANHAVGDNSAITVHACCFRLSMTCKNMNDHFAKCMNLGGYDYFALLHADNAPPDGWAEQLVDAMELYNYDVIHAPYAVKNKKGMTTTAIGFSGNIWGTVRRISTTERKELPRIFDIEVLRKELDEPDAERMLFGTGVMVIKIGDWLNDFPAFTMSDRIVKHEGQWYPQCVSEDYMFSHWCANNGVRAGALNLDVGHWGRWNYSTADAWGESRDEDYFRDAVNLRGAVA